MTALERWTLANGLQVLYWRDVQFPLSCASMIFRVGSREELNPEAGLCSMTMDLLMQGTRKRNARQIARVMESVGASMGTQAHEDYAELGFVVPSTEIDKAFDVTADVLSQPSFPQEEIAKEKSHVLAALASRRDAIFNLAYDHLTEALYGDHPYGRPLEGTAKTVASFQRNDFKSWHQFRLDPRQGILSVISPLPAKAVLARLEKSIGQWHRGSALPPQRVRHFVPPLRKSLAEEVRSSFEQAYLMVGWQVPGAKHPDQIPLKVLNALLGGGMSSRLFVSLREKLGLAYEVSSFSATRLDVSPWVIYLGLPSEKLKTASTQLNKVLEDLARHGPTAAELAQAKAMIRGAFLMDRQSRRRQAWYTAWWEFLGRSPSYGTEFLSAVDSVTAKQIKDLLQRLLSQPRVTVTVIPK